MHKREIIIIIAFLFLVVLMGLLYFNNYNNITGAVVAEEQPVFYGTYSIIPSFKVSVDYNFEEYNDTINKTKILFEECSGHYNPENCINNKIKEFNEEEDKKLTWYLDCETEEEKFFYDFVEKYKQCHDSSEKEGICEFSLANGPKNKNFHIKLSNLQGKIKTELIDYELTELIDVRGIYITDKIDNETGETNKLLQNSANILMFFDESGKVKKISILTKKQSEEETIIETTDTISLYKHTENDRIFLSFIDNAVYSSFKGSKETYKPIKDTFKFCVKSDKQFYVYDEKNKKAELKNIEYRFALKFVDKVAPPPIKGINITDKLKDENSVLILWNESPANDVKEYIIYYSKEDFKDKETEELGFDENIRKKGVLENKKIEIEDIDLSICEFKEQSKPCNYSKYNKSLEKGKLYYWIKGKKYIYVLGNLEDDTDYGFMVVAIDYSGNMIDNKEQKFILKDGKLPSGKSIDDLKPGLINTLDREGSEKGKITLSWDRAVNNLDGSLAYDITSFNIYYMEKDLGEISELDWIGKKININEPLLSKFNEKPLSIEELNCESIAYLKCEYTIDSKIGSNKIYLFGVTALDEVNNEYEYIFVKPFAIP